jgi:ubiquinone/menaquinone biosynthesis C-methylase UbiE
MTVKQEQVTRRYNLWSQGPLYQIGSFGALGPWERKVRTEAVSALRLSSGTSVLDVASGTGANLSFLEEAVGPTGSIVAIDFNPSMLARARARAESHGWENIRFLEMDAAAMTFEAEFDGALCTLGLSVIPHWREAMEAMIAAVKPGCRVAVLDAQYLKGARRILNPYIRLMDLIAGSEVARDLTGALQGLVNDFRVSERVFGAIFVASGVVSEQ